MAGHMRVFVVAIIGLCCTYAGAAEEATSRAASLPSTRPTFPVGKDTTRLLGPLLPDGRVDYVAALNEKYGKGVTPDNNAAVKLVDIFGTEAVWPPSIRNEVLRRLGVTEPAASRPSQWVAADTKLSESLFAASRRVWSEAEYPEVAAWLKANERPLAEFIKASDSPRYYMPLVATAEPALSSVSLPSPSLGWFSKGSKALIARASLAIGQGRFEDARRDMQAVYRLAGLLGQDAMMIGRMVSVLTDKSASVAIQNMATSGKLSADQARELILDIQSVSPPANMTEAIDESERYVQLDIIAWIAMGPGSQGSYSTPYERAKTLLGKLEPWPPRSSSATSPTPVTPQSSTATNSTSVGGATSMPVFTGMNPQFTSTNNVMRAVRVGLPVSEVTDALHLVNGWYDQEVEIARYPTFRQIAQGAAQERARMRKTIVAQRDRLGNMTVEQVRETRGWFGFFVVSHLTFSLDRELVATQLASVNRDLAVVALALAACKAEESAYPQTLSELVPTYLKELPKDFCSGDDFVYKPEGDGYLLYSVGKNMIDDNGDPKLDIVVQAKPR
jgi:hypothetical protein